MKNIGYFEKCYRCTQREIDCHDKCKYYRIAKTRYEDDKKKKKNESIVHAEGMRGWNYIK